MRATIVWAWKIKEGLCHWVHTSKDLLEMEDKPSPEAKIVKCGLMEYKDYLKLRKEATNANTSDS